MAAMPLRKQKRWLYPGNCDGSRNHHDAPSGDDGVNVSELHATTRLAVNLGGVQVAANSQRSENIVQMTDLSRANVS